MALQTHFDDFLKKREPPKTFCPSEVARALTADELRQAGYEEWREAMDDIRRLAWELRDQDVCEITQKGEVVGQDVGPNDVKGPIRVRRKVST